VRRPLALSLLAAAVLTGVAAAAPPVRHPVPGQPISLSTPAGWKAVSPKDVLTPGYLQKLRRENPALAEVVSALAQPSSPTKLIVVDPQVRQGFASNVNVVVERIPTGTTLKQYADAAIAGVRSLKGISGLRRATVRLPAGPAEHVTYRLTFAANGKQLTVVIEQYAFVHGPAFVVTYSTLPSLRAHYAPIFADSARSIRFAR